ncbi:hypothetical protein EAI_16852 [Harpegnathos saltator]|uniref:Uncharacterized protein n=1 Tax=Harpegnathos saltator TaxID=610380 RepID=E2BXY6_HARSA|nr:hypothetical protein EAI_16852 [Harpegnathos saltator]
MSGGRLKRELSLPKTAVAETKSSPVPHGGDQSPLLKRGNAENSQLNTVDSNHKASTQQGILAPQSTQQSVECVGLNLD